MIDSRDVKELHPCVRRGAEELKRRMEAQGYPMGISSTYRDQEKQNALYAQGRTKPGSIVTNARGGQSIHNWRLAFDVFFNVKGQEFSNTRFFNEAGRIWTEMGGVWGGSWVGFVDKPHMEYTGGLSLSQLQQGKKLPDDAKMKWEQIVKPQAPQEEEAEEMRYNTLAEMPDYAKPTIEKLMKKGILAGDSKGLDLSLDMVRMLVMNDRAGIYE